MRVFLDTNVLVSAFASRGLCNDLLTTVLSEHDLVLSALVLDEFERVLREKLRLGVEVVEGAQSVVRQGEQVSDSPAGPERYVTDEADAMILASAIHADADVFVTGDRELLSADEYAPIPIVSPRRFMELLQPTETPYPAPSDEPPDSHVSEPKANPIREKSFQFALEIIKLYRALQDKREYVISKQLLRSGTSIGANIEEALAGVSRKDFLNKLSISSKEARETLYWLRLLRQSNLVDGIDVGDQINHADELVSMLTAIIKTTATTRERARN